MSQDYSMVRYLARARCDAAEQAFYAATDHFGDLCVATHTAKRDGDVEAEKKAQAAEDSYCLNIWKLAWQEKLAAAQHLAEALGLDPVRFGSARR